MDPIGIGRGNGAREEEGVTRAMTATGLILSGRDYAWAAGGVAALVLGIVVWSYRAAPAGPWRWLCSCLKLVGVGALAFCLLDPLWSGQRARPGANLFAVVADNSQSLQVRDQGDASSRAAHLRALLDPGQSGWLTALEGGFELRRYFFDSRLQATRDFSEMTFDGRSSAVGSALRTMAERYRGRPLAGILLLTDGNASDLRGMPDLAGLPPVYPVVLGTAEPIRDLAVQQASATQSDFEDAPVSVQVGVSTHGFAGQAIVARLLDGAGKQIAEQQLTPRGASDPLTFRFQFRPEKPGLSFYSVRVRARGEAEDATAEATLANNRAILAVDRGQGPYRILYVSGRPNWEFKFLNRAVQEDDQLQLVGLIRVARREPKFNFMGRPGETSNPLFRGFGNQSAEEIERYDQPVLVRLNTRDEIELRSGFPRSAEELYGYHAVIVDDLEAEFFSPDQASLLQKFVSERGGGFLMLGGMESFQSGRYFHHPIGDMLPVYLDRAVTTPAGGPWRLDLSREGWLQSWARLRDNETEEKARLGKMVSFQVLNRLPEIKPGASVLATVTDAAGKVYPALITQRFGRGHTAALALGDLWRWGFQDAEAHRDLDKAWRQFMRWLVNDVPNRVDLVVEPQVGDAHGAMRLQVRVRDPVFQPLDNARVRLEIERVLVEDQEGLRKETASREVPGANSRAGGEAGASSRAEGVVHLEAEASVAEAGLYEASYVPRATGGYRVIACVTNALGVAVGRAAAGWSTDLTAEEFRSLTPNLSLLETIARQTGGEIIPARKLDSFARDLPRRRAPVMESWTSPFWHTPALFSLAMGCLLAEWGLRRWKGMP